jgi:tetratricopeptide (TPR) repeat protein
MRNAALAALRRGLAVFPAGSGEAAVLLAARVEIPRNAGQFDAALSAALEYAAVQPERIRAWLYLAEMYERNGRRDLAIRNAQKALAQFSGRKLTKLEETDRAALEKLAQTLRELPPVPPVSAAGR